MTDLVEVKLRVLVVRNLVLLLTVAKLLSFLALLKQLVLAIEAARVRAQMENDGHKCKTTGPKMLFKHVQPL